MTSSTDHRQAASARIADLIGELQREGGERNSTIIEECEALARAVGAFHMEGIRFRIFNVDRLVAREGTALAPAVPAMIEDIRRHLEAAGFHTRSHQAPGHS
jgi:hypothetical protein